MSNILLLKKASKIAFNFVQPFLHLCASKMRMEPLLFADENAPEWAFSKRKRVKVVSKS